MPTEECEQHSSEQVFTPWNSMKKSLISPGVFKPSYLKECEQGTNCVYKFNASTASMWLTLHEENSICSYNGYGADTCSGIPYPREGLHALECVMGDKVISHGRFYWEVTVSNAKEYCVGVAYTHVPRNTNLGDNNQSWVLRKFRNQNSLYAMTMGRVEQHICHNPSILGVLFDYEKGILSFYDAESRRHLYSFYSGFSEPCVPAFSICCGGWIQLQPPNSAKVRYTVSRPRSHYVKREQTLNTVTWAPDRPINFKEEPQKWRMPHAERDWDGTWKIQRVKSAQVNSTKLQ